MEQTNKEEEAENFLLEAKLVHGDREVAWLIEALVGVSVVHGDEVDVAEDKAAVVVVLQRLRVAHIEQLGSVERLRSSLVFFKQ